MTQKPLDKAYLASEAKHLLEHPLFAAALEELERDALEDILRLPHGDPQVGLLLERIRLSRGISNYLRGVITAGTSRPRQTVA